jgi:NTE family protein
LRLPIVDDPLQEFIMRKDVQLENRLKHHWPCGRPPFECIALLLQGGGALGSYQGGVYEGLAEAGLRPDWTAGISIGAINAALIAGNPPEERVEKLRQFWELVTSPYPQWRFQLMPTGRLTSIEESGAVATSPSQHELAGPDNFLTSLLKRDATRILLNQWSAGRALSLGAPGFFAPRPLMPWLWPHGTIEATSYYDTGPLRATLERLVDFDRSTAAPCASASARSMSAPATSSISTPRLTASARSM